jgi:hypothetical protein
MALNFVEEDEYGMYIWVDGQGLRIANEDNETLNIPSKKGDRQKIDLLRQAARHYGVMDGKPVFLSSRRRVTHDEWDHQMERLNAGLIPDPLDFHAMKEQAEYGKRFGT